MIWINWFVAFLALAGTVLNVKQKRSGFILWSISNVYWSSYNFSISEYPQAALFFVYTGLSIWGFLSWRKKPAEAAV